MTRSMRALLLTACAVLPLAAATVWTTGAFSTMVDPPAEGGDAGPRDIQVRVHAWGFSPSVVRVKPGQRVRFAVVSDDIKHGFAINELHLNLQLVPGREVRSPTLDVDLPEGTYAIHCSMFCGLGHPSMKGRLIVGTPDRVRASAAPWIASLLSAVAVAGLVLTVRRRNGRDGCAT